MIGHISGVRAPIVSAVRTGKAVSLPELNWLSSAFFDGLCAAMSLLDKPLAP